MKLSIITINFNDSIGLGKTLDSVARQSISQGLELEHIIVDGGSKDASVEMICQYEQCALSSRVVKWVSEPDDGIYNAMNKGIRMASGDYIEILNAGDRFASDDVLARMTSFVQSLIHQGEAAEIVYGNMIRQRADGIMEGKSGEVAFSLRQYYSSTMNHDCCWIRRSLFDQYGLYDETLKIVSDWKWFMQVIALGHVKPVYVDIDMTIFDTTGVSERNMSLRNEERRRVVEELLPAAVLADYDAHAFDMEQMDNLRKHPWAYKAVWLMERILNRWDHKIFRKPKKNA
ncbi:MAG: glycosyltransferase [Paludibacteraceae bacterium]|nr:glycosyltransferase [Paludibacteraceae bacterium]